MGNDLLSANSLYVMSPFCKLCIDSSQRGQGAKLPLDLFRRVPDSLAAQVKPDGCTDIPSADRRCHLAVTGSFVCSMFEFGPFCKADCDTTVLSDFLSSHA